MSVNGITNVSSSDYYSTYKANNSKSKTTETTTSQDTTVNSSGVIYESSASEIASASKADRSAIVAQMQADMDQRTSQLQSIVTEMLGKQANTSNLGDGIWKLFAQGQYETIDEAAVAQAKEDISENGYWGVNQTSDRIIDFAVALAGDDEESLNKMVSAFKKGYEKAEKMWGGELPELCKSTYDTVLEKFDNLLNSEE